MNGSDPERQRLLAQIQALEAELGRLRDPAPERQLRQIIDLVPHMLFAKNEKGEFLLANAALANAYGTTVEAITGQSQSALHTNSDEVERMLEQDRSVIQTGEPLQISEEQFTDVQGRRRIIQTTKIPFEQTGTRRPAILGVAVDITDVHTARAALADSLERHRHLVMNTEDMVFTLDGKNQLESVSPSFQDHLGIRVEDLSGRSFVELLFENHRLRERKRNFLHHIVQTRSSGKASRFVTEFRTRNREPYEVLVRLEAAGDVQPGLVFGKATRIPEDVLAHYSERESLRFVIPALLTLCELLSRRLTLGLAEILGDGAAFDIRMGLWEILINAVEHGSLEISFEEKTRATEQGCLPELIQERQRDARFQDRRICVEYDRTNTELRYLIRDEGPGFDPGSRTKPGLDLAHGRGIDLARSAFDRVEFNACGNEVTLIRDLTRPPD